LSAPTLRPYQLKAGEALEGAFFDAGQNRVLIKKPTGTGKTVWFAALLKEFPRLRAWLEQFPEKQRKMLVIAHREELLDQAAAKIRAQNPGLMVDIEQGPRFANRYSDVIIASIQTLQASKFKRLRDLMRFSTFRIVVVDEAHHAAAATYRTALVHLGFLPQADASDENEIEAVTDDDVAVMEKNLASWDARAPKDRLLVGVTATPNRSDAIGLGCVFQTIAFSYGLKEAINDGWLVPIKPWVIETTDSLDNVRVQRGEFNQRELADTVNNPRRNALAVEGWAAYAGDQSTLAFTVDVQHAHDLAEAFRVTGVTAQALSGETPKEERRAMLAAYTRGDLQVITNCMVLTEGTDLPRTGCILHAKPTKSATLYEQMTGRGLRIHPGKTECVIIDVVDVARRHSLQSSPVLYGLPPSLSPQGKTLQQIENEFEAFMEKHPGFDMERAGRVTMEQLEVRASTFNIWDIPELGPVGASLAMKWVRVGTDSFRLQYPWQDGVEIVSVAPDVLGHYDVSITLRPSHGAPPRQRTLATQIDGEKKALMIAEQFVKDDRPSVVGLKGKNAGWRLRPATPGQMGLLRKLRAPMKPNLTAGEASDLIDMANARRAR